MCFFPNQVDGGMGISGLHVLGNDGLVADIKEADVFRYLVFPRPQPGMRRVLNLLAQDLSIHLPIYPISIG